MHTRTIQDDLTFLKSALLWACGSTDEAIPLVSKNALAGFAIPDESDPRRPVMRTDTAMTYARAEAAHVRALIRVTIEVWTLVRPSVALPSQWPGESSMNRLVLWLVVFAQRLVVRTHGCQELLGGHDTRLAVGGGRRIVPPVVRRSSVKRPNWHKAS